MKESYEYPNLIYSTRLMLMEKKNLGKSYSLFETGESPDFDYFLFGMKCCLKELSHINILGTVL